MHSLIGRERELATATAFLDGAASGLTVLLIDGDPGIGKTTVWGATTEQARDLGYRVLSCRPAQGEISMPFVSLGDLLEPALDGDQAGMLPPAQRLALEAALVRVHPQESFGRLAVSRATLALLRELAATAPLLIAIDDVQWLDTPSAAVLQFAFRRLAGGEIRSVIQKPCHATREVRQPLQQLRVHRLHRQQRHQPDE